MPGNEATSCLGRVHKMLGGCLSPKELEQQPRELPSTDMKSNAELQPMTSEQHLHGCPPVKNHSAQVQALISKFEVGHQGLIKTQSGHSALHPTPPSRKGQFDGREHGQQERLDMAAEQHSQAPKSPLGRSRSTQLSGQEAAGSPRTTGAAPTSKSRQAEPVTSAQCVDNTRSKPSSNRHHPHRAHAATGGDDEAHDDIAGSSSISGSYSSDGNTALVCFPGTAVEPDGAIPAEMVRFHYGTVAGRPHRDKLSVVNTHIATPPPPSSEAAESPRSLGTVTIQVSLQLNTFGETQGPTDNRNGYANDHGATWRPPGSRALALVAVGVATAAVLIHGHPAASIAVLRKLLGAVVSAAAGYIKRGVRGVGSGVDAAASSKPAGGGRLIVHKVSAPSRESRRRAAAAVKLLQERESGAGDVRINGGTKDSVRALWNDVAWLREARQECHSRWCDVMRPPAPQYFTTDVAEQYEPGLYGVDRRIIEKGIRSTWG